VVSFEPPLPVSNPASEGIARMCGPASSAILILATLGVSLAMGSAVALLITKRADVARVASGVNLLLAALLLSAALRQGSACGPIGAMAASLPGMVGIVSFVLSLARGRQKNDGPEAKSG
jgi:hypothetical protein